jgi:ribonuclease T2
MPASCFDCAKLGQRLGYPGQTDQYDWWPQVGSESSAASAQSGSELMRKITAFVAIFSAATGLISASTHLSLAEVPLSGSFLATKECPAFQSFRKGTNPGGVKIESGHSYPLLAKNAPNATHYRVRIESASPPERWVSADCGIYKEENVGSQTPETAGDSSPEMQTRYVLSVGWEPGFCESHANKSECESERSDAFDATHFTLHGLWPQPRRREYCDVPQELIEADRRGNWQALPTVDLSKETRDHLAVVMPGTRSLLDRHEWIRHGTCYGGDAETYFRQAMSLVDAVNSSPIQSLFASNVGREISMGAIKDAFNLAFGAGAGDRIRLACKRDGSRRLITEITIGLGARPDGGAAQLTDLIKTSSPTDSGCPGGIVDPVGYQ